MEIREILRKNNFRFNKRFGQNFISDENLLEEIVEKSGADNNTVAVEIGCGAGTLTRAVAAKVKKIYGFEIDRSLEPVLKETLKGCGNAEIIFKDIMRMKTEEIESLIGEKYMLIANLPYYITTPVLMKFVGEAANCYKIVVMVQEEVAQRLCAKAGTEAYGAITAGIDVVGDAEIIERVNRSMFYPVPNVDSAVVKITINRNKFAVSDMKIYRDVVRAAFSSRRKTLVNNLIQSFGMDRSGAENFLNECGIDKSVRGEVLTTEQFVRLANARADK